MNDEKIVFHIEVEPENAGKIWPLLSENLKCVITKKQHSIDGKDLNIHIRIDEKK